MGRGRRRGCSSPRSSASTGPGGSTTSSRCTATGPGEAFDGVTTLAALAGQTSRIRLGLLVTGVTYRHPSVFASQMVTVDHASHGRLELSLGAAWFDKEHTELGIPFPPTGQRFDLLEDTLEICTRLMTGDDGVLRRQGRVAAATRSCGPTPVQTPHPPIWIGGNGPKRTLPLVARYADVWHAFGTPNSLAEASARIDELAVEAGRAARPTSCGPARCRSTTSTPPASTPPSGATPASATSCAAGPAPAAPRSRPSPARSCPTSPDDRAGSIS